MSVSAESREFTLEHFVEWAARLVLDNETRWTLEPFQEAFLADVFDGVPECWLIVPEGNGKTTLLAGLGLYHCQFKRTASVPIAASSREQAEIMYRQAEGFVFRSPELAGRFKCQEGYRRIKCAESGSRIQVFAADDRTGDGVIPTLAMLDELHRHRDLRLYRTWRGKIGKRGGQIVTISTAGDPGEEFEMARERIRQAGEVSRAECFVRARAPQLVLHEWAVPEDGDVDDMNVVKAANPFSGVTCEGLAEKRASPTMTDAHWRRFTCNLATRVDGSEPFIDPADWARFAEPEFVIPAGARVCLGGDGSRTWDTTVIAWAWRRPEDDRVLVDARVFSVRGDVGHHVLHTGGKIDFDDVEEFVVDRFGVFDVAQCAYDPRYLERSMDLVESRLPADRVAAVQPQSAAMRAALQAMFNLAAQDRLRHAGDPVLAAHVANSVAERGFSSELRRVRKLDGRLPIDAVPAMALAVWQAEQQEPSVYQERGVLTV